MNRKINVLGATYKIEEIKEQDKLMIDNSLCGYCDFYEKDTFNKLGYKPKSTLIQRLV